MPMLEWLSNKWASSLIVELPSLYPSEFVGSTLLVPSRPEGNKRKPTLVKTYISIFVCFATKAVHLEPVEDLSTPTFLAALTRFVSKRRVPSDIHSDHGTNFVGSARKLTEVQELLRSESFRNTASHLASTYQIHWHFIPQYVPHFGGLWKSAVKAMKNVLKKILGSHQLYTRQFDTVIAHTEAMLNSRPMAPLDSSNSDGPSTFTAGHFLVFQSLKFLPHRDLLSCSISYLKCWDLTQRLIEDIWTKWRSTYPHHLQARAKWKKQQPNLQVGDRRHPWWDFNSGQHLTYRTNHQGLPWQRSSGSGSRCPLPWIHLPQTNNQAGAFGTRPYNSPNMPQSGSIGTSYQNNQFHATHTHTLIHCTQRCVMCKSLCVISLLPLLMCSTPFVLLRHP